VNELFTSFIQGRAKNRLVVIACLAGNDYAANIRGKSFGIIRPIVMAQDKADKADVLLTQVRAVSPSDLVTTVAFAFFTNAFCHCKFFSLLL
jgi:hypothetical protein